MKSSSSPRILFITPVAPSRSGVGGLWTLRIAQSYDNIVCVYFSESPITEIDKALVTIPLYYFQRPPEHGFQSLGKRFRYYTRSIYEAYVEIRYTRKIINEIVEIGRKHQIDKILVYMQTATVLRIITRVATRLSVPIIPLVTDPPEFKLSQNGMDIVTRSLFLKYFDEAIKLSDRCGVVSEEMKYDYALKYNTESVVLNHSISKSLWIDRANREKSPRSFVIGFSGTLYALKEWSAFLDALSSVNWMIADKQVKIRLIGFGADLRLNKSVNIEYFGWRTEEETLSLLFDADVAYLPYRFEPQFRETARQAFPSKLTTYVAAGLPFLYHGPLDSSITSFIQRYPVGTTCHSLDESDILNSLMTLADNTNFEFDYELARKAAFENAFSDDVFRRSLAQLLDVNQSLIK